MAYTTSEVLKLIEAIKEEGNQLLVYLDNENCTKEEIIKMVYSILTEESEGKGRFSPSVVNSYLETLEFLREENKPLVIDYIRALRPQYLVYFLKC